MDRRYVLVALLVVLPVRYASAGLFFGKKTKPTPTERVPELIKELRTDGDEHKRSSAAEELRQYDPQQFPEMVPALVDALLNDNKPGVRAEAAQTLGKLRPVNTAAGTALEQALSQDASMRVRLQVRSSLMQYRWAGYSPKPKDEPPPQSKEPPLAPELPAVSAPRLSSVPPATTLPNTPRPLPSVTTLKPAAPPTNTFSRTPATPTSLNKATKTDEDKGPELTPP
jgi:HEAT repeats